MTQKELTIEIGELISQNHKISLLNIQRMCDENGLVFIAFLRLLLSIPCFKLQEPIGAIVEISPFYKKNWRRVVNDYFKDLNHKNELARKEEEKLDLSIAEKKRTKWTSIITLCIALASLIVSLIALVY